MYKIQIMQFEWDKNKNASNEDKHGIAFEDAKDIFKDINNYKEKTNKKDELRYKIVGLIFEKLFTVIYTMRNSIIRVISARRANKTEEKKYNNKNE